MCCSKSCDVVFVTALLLLDKQQQMVFCLYLCSQCIADRNRKGSQQENQSAEAKMEYKDFVWFLLAEENKTSPRRSVHELIGLQTTGARSYNVQCSNIRPLRVLRTYMPQYQPTQ